MAKITIDVETRAGARQGWGPIYTAYDLEYNEPLSSLGQFSFVMPGSDPWAADLTERTHVIRVYLDDTEVFVGIVIGKEDRTDSAGINTVRVSGYSRLYELAERMVKYESPAGVLENDLPNEIVTAADTVANGAAAYGTQWNIDAVNGDSATAVSTLGKFWGSALSSLIAIAESVGENFVYKPTLSTTDTEIIWKQTVGVDSGYRAIQGVGDPIRAESNTAVCFVQGLEITTDAAEVANVVEPYGAGNAETRLTIVPATDDALYPDYTVVRLPDPPYVQRTSETVLRERILEFKNIGPVSNTDADVVNAANALLRATVRWMDRYYTKQTYYRLSVLGLSHAYLPGQKIRLIYVDAEHNIDELLFVVDVVTRVDNSGAVAKELLISTIDRLPTSANSVLVRDIIEARTYLGLPQMGANAYTTGYRVMVGENVSTQTAEVPFWFGNEVAQIQQVLVRFRLGALTSTVQSIAGSSTTTPSGGGSTTVSGGGSTTVSGGGSTSGTADPTHYHVIEVVDFATPALSLSVTALGVPLADNSGSGNIDIGTQAQAGGAVSHDHTTPNHQHATPDHQHATPDHAHTFTPNLSSVYGVYKNTAGNTFAIDDLEYRVTSDDAKSWHECDPTPASRVITSIVGAAGTVTVICSAAHYMYVGNSVTIAGTGTLLDGIYTILTISGGPPETTFTYASAVVDSAVVGTATPEAKVSDIGSGWYEVDITSEVYDADTYRPLSATNLMEFRRAPLGSTGTPTYCAQLDLYLNVRNIIQSIAYL